MVKGNKKIISYAAAISVIFSTVSLPASKALAVEANSDLEVTRIYGSNRYETSTKAAEKGWTSSDYVIIINGDNFSDALCALPLAKKYDAPVLLTSRDNLGKEVLNEIVRLGAKHAFIIGGTGAVSDSIISQVNEKGIKSVERIYGNNRYDTAVKIAEKMGVIDKVVVVSGENFADALSIASTAANKGMPILLTNKDTLPNEVSSYLLNKNISASYVVGGSAVVSDDVKNKLPQPIRLSGRDRYDTNRRIINEFTDIDFSKIYFAEGETGFADAIVGSALAARTGSPVILTNGSLSEESKELVKANIKTDSSIMLLGGEKTVSSSVTDGLSGFKAYDKDGCIYGGEGKTAELDTSVKVTGKNVSLKNIKTPYSVYIQGEGATLENVEIGGTLYLDPGEKGTSNIKNVNAKRVVVLSGAQESNHADSLIAESLIIKSKNPNNNPRIEIKGKSNMQNTIIDTAAILDVKAGTFGNVQIEKSEASNSVVELRGSFDKPIIVTGDVRLKAAGNAKVSKVIIAPKENGKVILDGVYDSVEVVRNGKLEMAPGSKVTGKIIIASDVEIVTDKTAVINKFEIASEKKNSKVVLNGVAQTEESLAKVTNISNNESTSASGGFSGGSSGGGPSSPSPIGGGSGTNAPKETEVAAPILQKDSSREYGLKASSILSGAKVYLYKYTAAKKGYERCKDNKGQEICIVPSADGVAYIDCVYPGKYKITQIVNKKESALSDELILKPEKLDVLVYDSSLFLTNALEGSIITLYSEDNQKVLEYNYENKVLYGFQNVNPGNYYVTQSFNDVESDKSEPITINAGGSGGTGTGGGTHPVDYIQGVMIIDSRTIEPHRTADFTTTPGEISVREVDKDGIEIGENLVDTTNSSISLDNKKEFIIKLNDDLFVSKEYKLDMGRDGSIVFRGIMEDNSSIHVNSAVTIDEETVQLNFSEPIDAVTASNTENYLIDQGIGHPISASYNAEKNSVTLKIEGLIKTKQYSIKITGLKDLYGIIITSNKVSFVAMSNSIDITRPSFTHYSKIDDKTIKVYFSEGVSVKDNTEIEDVTGAKLAVANVDSDDNTAIILTSIDEKGFGSQTMSINFSKYVKDLSGNSAEDKVIEIKIN